MNFVEWMKSVGLSQKSADSYAGAIKGRLTNWAMSHQITTRQIIDILDSTEFLALACQLRETPEFKDRNLTGNGMYSAALSNYQKYLQSLKPSVGLKKDEPYHQQLLEISYEQVDKFDPNDQDDARTRVLRQVVQRRGQQKFRKTLIAAYGGRCAITGCSVTPLLEAAHITPYLGPDTNSITNGLLLRADLHTLWDLGLIAIDPDTQKVWISTQVNDSTYQNLSGHQVSAPADTSQQPSVAALKQQWSFAQKSDLN